MKRIDAYLLAIMLLAGASQVAHGSEPAIDGVFGLAPMPETAALAIWVPLDEGQSVAGMRWYNNDSQIAFPRVLAVAGEADRPELVAEAVVVGTGVTGGTLQWSELTFEQPLASETPGLYLVFELPAAGAFEAEGVGSGVGYTEGDGEIRSWVAIDDNYWHRLSAEYQMAIEAVMNGNKSADVLVLKRPSGRAFEGADGEAPPVPLVAALGVAPNPFNPSTEISFTLPSRGHVKVALYDVRGRLVRTLVDGHMEAGQHSVRWMGRDNHGRKQASGVYLALFESGVVRMTRRLTLVQ